MKTCANCLVEEQNQDGIITFYGNLCEDCYEREQHIKVLIEDHNKYGDFDYSMN